ncbi:hypothetical protein JXM67_10265 [candidate division WOR-3 bacterium]|nr:hypothetical protein [candidate division WOR-3 bacterium]
MISLLLLILSSSGLEYSSSFILGGEFRDAALDDSLLYIADGRGIRVLTQDQYRERGFSKIPGRTYLIALYNDTLYAGGDRGLVKLAANQASEDEPGVEYLHRETLVALAISGETLYFADTNRHLYVRDIPYTLTADTFNLSVLPARIIPHGEKVYLACDTNGLWVIDFSSSSPEPKELEIKGDPPVMDVVFGKEIAYLACAEQGLWVAQIKRNSLKVITAIEAPGQIQDLASYGDRLAAAAGTGDFLLFSVENPAEPHLIQEANLKGTVFNLAPGPDMCFLLCESMIGKMNMQSRPGAVVGAYYRRLGEPYDMLSRGEIAFIAGGDMGIFTLRIGDSLEPLAYYNTNTDCRRLYLYGSQVYVLSSSNMLNIVDVKDPSKPERRTSRDFKSTVSGIDAAGEMVLAAEQEHGLGAWWRCPCGPLHEQGRLNLAGRTLDVRILDKIAFVSTASPPALYVIDWSDSTQMQVVASLELQRDYERLYLIDKYLLGLDDEGALAVFNVARPIRIKEPYLLDLVGTPQDLVIDSGRIFIAAGKAGVHQVDFSKPSTPSLVRSYDVGQARGVAFCKGRLLVSTPYAVEAFNFK